MTGVREEYGRQETAVLLHYDVGAALGNILDGNRASRERAVFIFEFHVALLHCEGPAGDPGRFSIVVPARPLQDARLFAAMRLAENDDKNLLHRPLGLRTARRRTGEIPSERWQRARDGRSSANLTYRVLLNRSTPMFMKEGGWSRAKNLPAGGQFEQGLKALWSEFASVAPLLDFSLRLDPKELGPRQRGGITMALEILAEDKLLGVSESRATLRRRWKRYEPVAVFAYLFALQKYERPRRLTARGFAKRLLTLARDDGEWRRLISSYEQIRTRLRERNYTGLPVLWVPAAGGLPPADVSIDPLPRDVCDAVVRYSRRSPTRRGEPSRRN